MRVFTVVVVGDGFLSPDEKEAGKWGKERINAVVLERIRATDDEGEYLIAWIFRRLSNPRP